VSTPATPSSPPKPITELWRPELTRLPRLNPARRLFRRCLRAACRILLIACTRPTVRGMGNFPRRGPALVVTNHLGDADMLVFQACLPVTGEILTKIELIGLPVLGRLLEAFGVIWVHRGRPDRRALSAALEGLRQGRFVAVAPEGRESLTGGLEPGTEGAAFLALQAGVPVVPVTVTGTENAHLLPALKRLRRTPITLTVGEPFVLRQPADRHTAIREGTRRIMETLARQLPAELRGVYAYITD
jgi:1-acyl-sn-glycerol-3-phosphate acyltransferase